jgi:phosphatidylinositol alpha-1,6-mannosyltransferase
MRITFIIDRFSPEPGGVQTVVTELANRLSATHDVVVAIPERTPRRGPQNTLEVTDRAWRILIHRPRLGARLLSAPSGYVALPVLRRYGHGRAGIPAARSFGAVGGRSLASALPHQPDVVHAFTADMTAHLALGLGAAVGAPVVCTGFPHPGQYGDGPIDSAAYRSAAGVVALTSHDRDVYLRLGVSPDRIAVIPPPSDDLGTGGREKARERLRITGPLVVFAGVRRDYKGADILYAAAPSIGARVADATIAFVGPGPALGAVPGITIRDEGEVDASTMADWIRAADVVVLPSLHEIFPIVILEAWSAGVPVVTSDIPALEHLVDVSGAGVTAPRNPAPLAAAVSDLLHDDDRRQTLGRSGRAYWQASCGLDTVAAAHEELYARLAGGQTSGKARQR